MRMSNHSMHSTPVKRAIAALSNVLPRSANVSLQSQTQASAQVVVNNSVLRVEWGGTGWLRDIRSLLESNAGEQPDIVAARRMSPGARAALSERGIGWVDETGAAEIAVDSILVSRSGLQPKEPERQDHWTPSVFAVAEALLCDVRATVSATQEATGLSAGSCVRALQLLESARLLESDAERGRNSARRVADPDELLNVYASRVATEEESINLSVGVTWRDPIVGLTETGALWNRASVDWACTGTVAAWLLAPHLTAGSSAVVYVAGGSLADLEAIAGAADLQAIDGGRLELRPFPTVTTHRFIERREGLNITIWPRVYADLRQTGVRGEEAAEHLRRVLHG